MAKPIVFEYRAGIEKTMKLIPAIVARLGYTLKNVDRENGIVHFEKGLSMSSYAGQSMSVHVLDVDDQTVQVTISGTMKAHGAQLQIYDWGEGGKIATKVFLQLDESLGKGKLINGQTASGFCFVATAVYGDYDHSAVLKLRKFRDTTLSSSLCGSLLIRGYYRCGPFLASLVSSFPALRGCVRRMLDFFVARL